MTATLTSRDLRNMDLYTERGLNVPGDVSVCGFDDIEAAREAHLTTVQQPIRRRGQLIGRLLIDPSSSPRQVMLPIRLLTRSSTGPARH